MRSGILLLARSLGTLIASLRAVITLLRINRRGSMNTRSSYQSPLRHVDANSALFRTNQSRIVVPSFDKENESDALLILLIYNSKINIFFLILIYDLDLSFIPETRARKLSLLIIIPLPRCVIVSARDSGYYESNNYKSGRDSHRRVTL